MKWSIQLLLLLLLYDCRRCCAQQLSPLTFNVNENVPIGTEVGRLSGAESGQYVYLYSNSQFEDYFNVERLDSDGVIVTDSDLDHEAIPKFHITVFDIANDADFPVVINVNDINDNNPTFSENTLSLVISEASQVGSKFDIGSATDPDSHPFDVRGYRIVDGYSGNAFQIVTRVIDGRMFADLILNETLNREETSYYAFTVEAYDGGVPPKVGTINITINVSDVNDNAPSFDLSRYTLSVGENLPVGTDIITLNATDRDVGANGEITYRIDRSQSDPNEVFDIDPESGRIYLNKKLDYEQQIDHKIVVEAVDGGIEPQVGSTVVIVSVDDVNDNVPVIDVIFLDAHEARVSEAAKPGDYIARVSVSDPDSGEISQVNVTLSGDDDRFGLQTENNVIYLVCVKNPLDRETRSSYHLTLTAVDLGSPSQTATASFTLVVEDVNDSPPVFQKDLYEITLREDAPPGTYVTQLQATDADVGINSEIKYRLLTSDQSDWFTINEDSGLITTNTDLDYDVNPSPRLVVIATDKGSPPLSSNTTLLITIKDTSDDTPKFDRPSYAVSVSEGVSVGSCILKVDASDPDSSVATSLSYSFVRGTYTPFSINHTTGDICVTSSLDRESTASYEFFVQAVDENGQFDRVRVDVTVDDVNEDSPVFHPVTYMVNVDRNSDLGFPITRVAATDGDDVGDSVNGKITFAIVSGNDGELFDLNSLTGQLSVGKSLKGYEVGSVYHLDVSAEDGGGRMSEENAAVTISIVDGSSTGGPVFTASQYDFEIDEDASISSWIGRVSASMSDNEPVTYMLRHDPPSSSWFAVNSTTGDVTVHAPMDHEIFPTVSFQVIGVSGSPPVYGFATVTVTLNDVNDNPPHFYGSIGGILPPITISNTVPVGSVITTLEAADDDEGLNAIVRYGLTSAYFGIDETTGLLSVKSTLPQQPEDYNLTIEARDLEVPHHVTTAYLLVRVRTHDANCPMFPKSTYEFNIAEDYPVCSVFNSIKAATDNATARISYYVTNEASSFPFFIYPNGSLYLDSKLDHETQNLYSFQVTAEGFPSSSFGSTSPCAATTQVKITIEDVNDNSPQFTESVYTFRIKEKLSKGTKVGEVLATDRDSGTTIVYEFDLASSEFSINSVTGEISTSATLDREIKSDYWLLVDASDSQNLAQATVHVIVDDVNDNWPTFLDSSSEHLAVVSVNDEIGTWVADMRATDDDDGDNGIVVYSFKYASSNFNINPSTGAIVTKNLFTDSDIGIDSLTIEAADKGTPSRSTSIILKVKIRASDANLAQFSDNKFVFALTEDAEPGTVLGSFNDRSVGRRRRSTQPYTVYSLANNYENIFFVNKTTGGVVLNRKLEFESLSQLSIDVEKREEPGGDVTILSGQFNVRYTNDHPPVFSKSSFTIGVDENAELGEQVWRFSATDQDTGLDGRVTYSLVSQSPAHAFVIDSNSGALLVDASLDRENITEYLLVVRATDNSLTSPLHSTVSCVVAIRDVNDNSPRFVGRTGTYVMEDEPVGYPVMQVLAIDPDVGANGHVVYAIVAVSNDDSASSGDDRETYFHIDSNTGILTLARKLDYESATTFVLNVSATDRSARNERTAYQDFVVHVSDVNDVTPHFEREIYDAEVAEGQGPGVIVTKIEALDEDSGANGNVVYQLQESSETANFTIDSITGVITTTSTLDREIKDSYSLTVFAQDSAFPSLYDWCSVIVYVTDINDNSPQFTPLDDSTDPPVLVRLEIPEQVDEPEVVHVISSFDADSGNNGKITYSIIDGNDAGDFFVNASTGELWTTKQLDRETTGSYRLEVAATDHGDPPHSSVVAIEVNVLDWNDNDPQFLKPSYHANVTESMLKGQYVLTVRAVDVDDGLNGEIRYFLASSLRGSELEGLFVIDPTTGVITTAAVLDREAQPRYSFSVTAVDSAPYGPRNSTVSVVVDVIDVNDNPPVFMETLVNLTVSPQSLMPGMIIGHVEAMDDDVGVNGNITYSFYNKSTSEEYFKIDSKNGNIRTTKSLTNLPSPYSLIVIATDAGDPPLSSEAVVLVTTAGGSDSAATLQFERSPYEDKFMWENVQKEYGVIKVKANVIGGSSGYTGISYSILFGNDKGRIFAISEDGDITVTDPSLLDFETKPDFPLFISATTMGASPVLYAFTTVNIKLKDENDNPPKFSQLNYYTRVWEEQSPSFVMQLFASDSDSGSNGEVRYHIASGDPDNAFSIDSMTGFLKTSRSLDREIHDKYELIVYATDLGENRKTGTCTVSVDVVDINDHSPTLVVPSEPLFISEKAAVGTLLTTVTANDVDTNQELTFYFASGVGNPGELFSIDRHIGNIFLTKSLDHEKVQNLTLIIEASDGAKTDSAEIDVIITDVNDNRPEFLQSLYHTTISELTPVNTTVITVRAVDSDSGENGRVSYRILNILPNRPMFVINPVTGAISINQSEPFSPHSSVFNLEVEAYDHGDPPNKQSVSVRIERTDVNNNAPSFSQPVYERQVRESAPLRFSVINVTATDADYWRDNKNIYYQIVAGNLNGAFEIKTIREPGKQTLGEILVADKLDREVNPFFALTVAAFDHGKPQLSSNATVKVEVLDVNDNRPKFNQSVYNGSVIENNRELLHNEPIPVLSVYATDPDTSETANLKFKIIAGNDHDSFDLADCSPPSVECKQIVAKFVDYERKPRYELTVAVSDQRSWNLERSATASVVIDVINVNEYDPIIVEKFKQEDIHEGVKANQSLFALTVRDGDAGEYGSVTFKVEDESSKTSGPDCKSPSQLFGVKANTGVVYAKQDLDYETCHSFYFHVKACDLDGCKSFVPVQINLLPVDEYSPQFFTGDFPTGGSGYRFSVPYGAAVGYVVGQVNATDKDEGKDGEIRYSLTDSADAASKYYVINETTGVISVSRQIDNGNAQILFLTASTTSQNTVTQVTIEVTGTPTIAPEAKILSIVFGVIAGVACAIVFGLAVKHCWNKRVYKSAAAHVESPKEKNNDRPPEKPKTKGFYDVSRSAPGSPACPDAKVFNETYCIGAHKKGAKVIGNNSCGDFQLHKMNFGNNSAITGSIPSRSKQKDQLHDNQGGLKFAGGGEIDTNKMLRHRLMKTHQPAHTGNDGSAEDEEVNRITSTNSSSGRQSSSASLLSDKRHRVADSGIQQDIDKVSEDTEPTRRTSQGESVESIHEFGDEGRGDNALTVPFSNFHPRSIEIAGGGGEEMAPAIDSLGPIIRTPKAALGPLLSPLDFGPLASERSNDPSQNWTPDFQPLSNVFSEIARLREESAAARHPIIQQPHPSSFTNIPINKSSFSDAGMGRPPPLLTSVPQRSGKLAAPVPISSTQANPGLHVGHVPLKGLYPRPSHQYNHGQGLPPVRHPQGDPPPYPSGRNNDQPRNSQSSLPHSSVLPFPPSTASGLSSTSLPRTPISHESSFTSPAMSPSLSPTMTTRSPPTSPLEKSAIPLSHLPNESVKVVRSRSDETNLTSGPPERMVHV